MNIAPHWRQILLKWTIDLKVGDDARVLRISRKFKKGMTAPRGQQHVCSKLASLRLYKYYLPRGLLSTSFCDYLVSVTMRLRGEFCLGFASFLS